MGREHLLTRRDYFAERARKSLFIANLVTVSLAGVGMVKLAVEHAWLTNLLNAALVVTVTTMNSLNVTNRYKGYVDTVEDDTRRHFERTYLCGICGEGYAHMGIVGFFFTVYVAWLLSDEVRTETFKDAAQTWLDVVAVFAIVVPQVMSVVADGELQYRMCWDGVKRSRRPEAARLVGGAGASGDSGRVKERVENIRRAFNKYDEVFGKEGLRQSDILTALGKADLARVKEGVIALTGELDAFREKIKGDVANLIGAGSGSSEGDGDEAKAAAGSGYRRH